jgi:hypothetical protein
MIDEIQKKNVVEKSFQNIGRFNEKYRIFQFILDEDIEI